MVTKYGMSDNIGPLNTTPHPKVVFGSVAPGDTSPAFQARIDSEVERLMKNAHTRAHQLINENRNILDAIANKLIEVETLEQDAYNEIIKSFGLNPKTA
jgi:cell division protease FtsH